MPKWHEVPRKNQIISLTALGLTAVTIVTVFIRSEMGLNVFTWWALVPAGVGLIMQAYNVFSILPMWEQVIEERRRRERDDHGGMRADDCR